MRLPHGLHSTSILEVTLEARQTSRRGDVNAARNLNETKLLQPRFCQKTIVVETEGCASQPS